MSGSIYRKKRRKVMRQQCKDEIRLYRKIFAEEEAEDEIFPNSTYAILTSEQINRLIQGFGIRRK